MTRNFIIPTGLLALPIVLAAQSAVRVESVRVSAPKILGEIDTDKLKGQPSRLSWSPDGTQLYLQMHEGDFGLPPKRLHHYFVSVADGKRQNAEGEPEWASEYWTAKSGQISPDGPPLRIELKDEVKAQKTVSTPMGGALARGGAAGDPGVSTDGDAAAAALSQQRIRVITTELHGTAVGIFEGTVLMPGRTFGWGPKGSRAITYADPKSGRVVVMDDRGQKIEIGGSKDAILPAWSTDGKEIAWLQKDGKKKYVLQVARVDGA